VDKTEAAEPSSAETADKKYLTVRQAAFIGVGAMVGAGKRSHPSRPVPVQVVH